MFVYTKLMKILMSLVFVFVGAYINAQQYVPYKVGEKFGIADWTGNVKLKPEFDFIAFGDDLNHFVAYKGAGDTGRTSLIHNDKIILKDTRFSSFETCKNRLIVAQTTDTTFDVKKQKGVQKRFTLYNYQGKLVTPQSFKNIYVYDEFTNPDLKEELLFVTDSMGKHSYRTYDKATGKINRTLVDNVVPNEDSYGYDYFKNNKLLIKAPSVRGQEECTIIYCEDGVFHVKELNSAREFYSQFREVEENDSPFNSTNYTYLKDEVKRVSINKDGHSKPSYEMVISTGPIPEENFVPYHQGNKKGILNLTKRQVFMPAEYDEIYFGNAGWTTIYITEKNAKFGMLLTRFKAIDIRMREVFDYLPYPVRIEYGKPTYHIVALYDNAGKFLYYANQDGLVYYSED